MGPGERDHPVAAPGAARLRDRLLSLPLHLLPHHPVSRVVHRLARSRRPWLRQRLIGAFSRRFRVDRAEAEQQDPAGYPDFNSFFTRALRPGARPLPDDPAALACPADGAVSAMGRLDGGRILQAKGRDYTVTELLGGDTDRAAALNDGAFATIYLSPRDYHRVHMPWSGTLRETVHIPGRLFSVAPPTVRAIPRLFARNERVACLFDTDCGPMAVVLVGAINVASIATVWAGEITPPRGRRIVSRDHSADGIHLERGAEMGRFNMGSTVIVLLPRQTVAWDPGLDTGQPVRMGQPLGSVHRQA